MGQYLLMNAQYCCKCTEFSKKKKKSYRGHVIIKEMNYPINYIKFTGGQQYFPFNLYINPSTEINPVCITVCNSFSFWLTFHYWAADSIFDPKAPQGGLLRNIGTVIQSAFCDSSFAGNKFFQFFYVYVFG